MRTRASMMLTAMLVGGWALYWRGDAVAEDLATYAATCDHEVGVGVQGFDCRTGYPIPMNDDEGGDCEKPPYLSSATCRSGSRLGVQVSTDERAVVWLCRKKKITDPNSAIYDDIAVIQTNFKNGATCFYQKLGPQLDGSAVPAPSTGTFWFDPATAVKEECASCHDTGLLRTPYLTQVKNGDEQVLPKTRHKTNYWFPGALATFGSWNGKVYKIDDRAPTKNCTKCHPMGANTIDPDSGTSTDYGPMATGKTATPFLKGQYAFWMSPSAAKAGHPLDVDKQDAQRLADCGLDIKHPKADCSGSPWGGQFEAVRAALRGRTLPALKQPAGSTDEKQK